MEQILTDKNFENTVQNSTAPVLVDFWAAWCGPCQMLSPIVAELAKEYKDKLLVGKLNVDENPQTAASFGIMSIPTVMIFKNGKPVQTLIGVRSKETFKENIDGILKSA